MTTSVQRRVRGRVRDAVGYIGPGSIMYVVSSLLQVRWIAWYPSAEWAVRLWPAYARTARKGKARLPFLLVIAPRSFTLALVFQLSMNPKTPSPPASTL